MIVLRTDLKPNQYLCPKPGPPLHDFFLMIFVFTPTTCKRDLVFCSEKSCQNMDFTWKRVCSCPCEMLGQERTRGGSLHFPFLPRLAVVLGWASAAQLTGSRSSGDECKIGAERGLFYKQCSERYIHFYQYLLYHNIFD